MEIIKKTSTVHTGYQANRPIKYIVLHYTAGTSSKKGVARNVAAMFGNPNNRPASADFIVDDAEIVQYNGDIRNRYCYSVGDKKYKYKFNSRSAILYGICRNYNSISIEMCSSKVNKKSLSASDTDWYITDAVVNNAIELTKYLMKTYNVPIDRVVTHSEITGKPCPQPWVYKEEWLSKWYAFKRRLTGSSAITGVAANEVKVNYTAMVTDSTGLNCREGIGTGFKVVKTYPYKAVLTITKEMYGWGYTGEGWVNLSYTKKVAIKKEKGVEDMTVQEFVNALDAKTAYTIYTKAMEYASKLETPTWAKNSGNWDKATKEGIVDGTAPERPIKRVECVEVLSRMIDKGMI